MPRFHIQNTHLSVFVLILSFLIGTFGCSVHTPKVVAKVGRYHITFNEIRAREQIATIYYPNYKNSTDELKTSAGFIQLREAFTYADILESNGKKIDQATLETEMRRIDANTKDPKTLSRIKEVFNECLIDSQTLGRWGCSMNLKKYLEVFILPNYAGSVIGGEFFQKLALHEQTHQKTVQFYSEVATTPKEFIAKALKNNLNVGEWCVSKSEGVKYTAWPNGQRPTAKRSRQGEGSKLIDLSNNVPNQEIKALLTSQWQEQEKQQNEKWFSDIINPTQLNTIVNKVIDQQEFWLVLKLVSKTAMNTPKASACFEAVKVDKLQFSQWLNEEIAKVKIEIIHPKFEKDER